MSRMNNRLHKAATCLLAVALLLLTVPDGLR